VIEIILYIVLLPVIFANVLHMFLVKLNVFNSLSIPIKERMFGRNKTYRGFLVLTFLTALFSSLGSLFLVDVYLNEGLLIGSILGFTYAVFELPNSFLKRRLGIEPGGKASRNKLLFQILDKTDSTFGVSLVYFLLSDLTALQGLYLFLGSIGLHVGFSFLLVAIKVKKSF
jgi:hypothetical protein